MDAGSRDPDTAELDSIVPIEATDAFYSPSLYAFVSAASLTMLPSGLFPPLCVHGQWGAPGDCLAHQLCCWL